MASTLTNNQLLNLVPYEILYQIFQYVDSPKQLIGLGRVHSSWRNIIGESNRNDSKCVCQKFWIEKLNTSNWLLKMVSLTPKQGISQILTKKCQLLNQWENDDCIKYWTSNYAHSGNDRSNRVFGNASIEMNESGLVIFKSLIQHENENYEMCRSTYIDALSMIDIQNRLCSMHIPSKEQHRMTWKDPSASSSVNSPLIPFVMPMSTDTNNSNIFNNLCQFLGVNQALVNTKDRYMIKSIVKNSNQSSSCTITNQTPVNNHPLVNTNESTINLASIFPKEQFNTEFSTDMERWIDNNLENPTLIILGLSQLNPIPIFLIGKSKQSAIGKSFNYIGLMTSSFRVPEFDE